MCFAPDTGGTATTTTTSTTTTKNASGNGGGDSGGGGKGSGGGSTKDKLRAKLAAAASSKTSATPDKNNDKDNDANAWLDCADCGHAHLCPHCRNAEDGKAVVAVRLAAKSGVIFMGCSFCCNVCVTLICVLASIACVMFMCVFRVSA
jgi:hypothetical protein